MKRHQSRIFAMGGLLALFVSQLLSGCSLFARWKTIDKGIYNGLPYVVQQRETKGFSTNRIDHRFRVGNLSAVEITALTTDWGPPYSNDIFGTAPYCYTTRNLPTYRNEEDTVNGPFHHDYTMLYLSPKTFSKEDYKQYCGFMKQEWPRIDSKYTSHEYSNFPHIIGLVYARQDDITKEYKGTYTPYPAVKPSEAHRATIRIQNDGRVELVDVDEQSNIRYSGLSTRVQMPGKRLFLKTGNDGLGSPDVLRLFKDKHGRSPDMDFQILVIPDDPK